MTIPPDNIASPLPPPKPRSRTGTLGVTFALGIVVGFALHEAYIEVLGRNKPDLQVHAPGEAAEPVVPINFPETEADELAALDGLWPARHLFVGLPYGPLSEETIALLGAFRPGGVVVTPEPGVPADEFAAWVADIKRAAGSTGPGEPPIIVGLGDPALVNPWADDDPLTFALLGGESAPNALTAAGMDAGAEARARGIEAMIAPPLLPLDKARTPEGLRDAALGVDAEGVGLRGAGYIAGIEAEGVLPVAWGYPWLNIAAEDGALWRVDETDLRVLSTLLLPFSPDGGFDAPGILVHHVAAPGYETGFPDRPATMSPRLVQAFLRGKRSYEGVILADDIGALSAQRGEPVEESFAQALGAGCDVVLLANADRTTLRRICAATIAMVGAGGLNPDELAASKARLDQWQARIAGFAERKVSARPTPQPPGTDIVRYEATAGQTLLDIALLHNVSLLDLKDWNGLYFSDVQPGQKLNLYVPEGTAVVMEDVTPQPEGAPTEGAPAETPVEAAPAEAVPETAAAPEAPPAPLAGQADAEAAAPEPATPEPATEETEATAESDAPPEAPAAEETPEPQAEAPVFKDASRPVTTYTVASGDTLHRIALKYKTSTDYLVHLNELERADQVLLGQKLKVPETSE